MLIQRLIFLLVSTSVLITPALPAADPASVTLEFHPLPLQTQDPTAEHVGHLRYLTGFHVTADSPDFGGFSGLVVDGQSRRLTAISDEGHWLTAKVDLAADGTLRGLDDATIGVLYDDDGAPAGEKDRRDAEEIHELPGRGFLVSFERQHRISLYPGVVNGSHPLAKTPEPYPFPSAIADTSANHGMEAFVVLGDGRLMTFAEELRTGSDDMKGWIGHPERADWRGLTLEPQADFLPTGAAVLPSGDVLLLERSYQKGRGNRVRLSHIATEDLVPGARLVPRELALLEPPNLVDNMEAVAAHSGPGGKTLVYLLSDDNFSENQRTLLLQFELVGE